MAEMSKEQIMAALSGPVASVATPFNRDGSIDFDGLRNFIDFVIAGGSKTVVLTAGDSLYTLLTDEEIAAVTRATVEHTAGRAMVIAAGGGLATPAAVEFAGYCRDVGADMLMLMPPDWARSGTVETFVAHYRAAAAVMPIMIVTNVFANWPVGEAMQVLEILRDTEPNLLAIKDDLCNAFARKMSLVVHGKWAVLSGGQKQNHLNNLPYGCDSYLSTFIMFKPEIPRKYWQAILADDIATAVAIIEQYDLPLFDYTAALQGGFDAGVHGTLELFGIAQRWRRNPYYSLSDAELEQLGDFYRGMGLL
jgi:4-hydroxy-tetrahydrodipicolinate synthase